MLFIFNSCILCGFLFIHSRYNPTTDTWSGMAPMSSGRYHHASATISNKILVMGGCGQYGLPISSVEYYDPNRNKWNTVQSMLQPRWGCEAGTVNDFVYVFGGRDSTWSWLTSIESYCMTNDTWTIVKHITSHIITHISFCLICFFTFL